MNAISIQLAGHVIEIISEYRFSPHLYSDFRTEIKPEVSVFVSDEDIDFLQPKRLNTNKLGLKMSHILGKIADELVDFDVLLMHGAVIAIDNKCYMFSAPSGTGKSTHIIQWIEKYHNSFVVNGDKPFIKIFPREDSQPLACGSPWAGKENLYTNTMVPLMAIVFMERAEDNRIQEISFTKALPFLLQQTYRPKNESKMKKTLRLLQYLNGKVKFYKFFCNNFKDDCCDVAFKELVRN